MNTTSILLLLLSLLAATFIPNTQGFLLQHQQRFTLTFLHNKNLCQEGTSSTTTMPLVTKTASQPSMNRLSSTYLEAKKKKRRRRKDNTASASESTPSPPTPPQTTTTTPPMLNDEDELPDFDLIEDIDLPPPPPPPTPSTDALNPATTTTAATAPMSPKKKSIDPNDPAIIAAMKATKGIESLGKSSSSSSSTKDLLRSRDRELESKLVVDEIVQDVPSFADYNAKKGRSGRNNATGGGGAATGATGGAGGMGKKAMKREQRRAAALEAEGKDSGEEGGGVGEILGQALTKLPFVEDKKDKSAVKLLEEGTWACIYILVAWEIYINTPLFDRAGPMAPVVFQDPVTMTFLI